MSSKRLISGFALCAALLLSRASAQNVIVLPGAGGEDSTVNVFTGDPFSSLGSFLASPDSFVAFSNPGGTRYYVLAQSGTDTLVVADGTFGVLQRFDLGAGATSATLTLDGQRLLVTAGSLHVFDTTQPSVTEIVLSPRPDVGVNPIDVAVSHDSSRAFILSSASRRLTAIDLSTFTVIGSVTIPGLSTGVAVAPTGLVYVSAQNGIYEVDGGTMSEPIRIPITGQPGRLVFTPDGTHALAANQTPVAGGISVYFLDLLSRTLAASFPNFGDVVDDKIVVVDDTRAFAFSRSSGHLFFIVFSPFNMDETTIPNLPGGEFSNVSSVVASDELPQARYLFVTTNNNLTRVDLNTNLVSGQLSANDRAASSFAGPAAIDAPASVLQYGNNQGVEAGGTTLPLVVRVLNATGRPIFNVPVNFTTTAEGATILGATATTNQFGFAQATVIAPDVAGAVTVNAVIAGGVLTAPFTINVGAGGPGGPGGISMVKGNGQVVRESFLTTEPLTVRVRDTDGAPADDVIVNFAITSGGGTLNLGPDGTASGTTSGLQVSVRTSDEGLASVNFISSLVLGGFSFSQSTVSASFGGATVDFIVTTVLNLLPGGGLAPFPTVTLLTPPPADRRIVGTAGETLPGAIRVQVVVTAGTQAGQPIPGVGVSATTGLDPDEFPSAACVGDGDTVLTNATGIATCDLKIGGKVGSTTLSVNVGGFNTQGPIAFRVDPGGPAVIQKIRGDNQTGTPGEQLPVLLEAQINDAGGNPLPGTPAQWEVVVPGSVTLSNVENIADGLGRVSAVATLGNTAGSVQVRVRSGTAVAVFNLTVTITVAQLEKVSGDNQTAIVDQSFGQPLVVQVEDAQASPVVGVPVTFSVASGSATLGTPNTTADSQGRASTTVTAGSTASSVVITVTSGSLSVTFNLTVIPPGPVVTQMGIRSAISGDLGVNPGGIVAIYGDGLAAGIQGSVVANTNLLGPLPLTLANVEVLFGTTPAPIYSVNNINGQQWVVVEAPFNLAAPGVVAVTIKVGGGSTVVNDVPVKAFQPGIFETLGAGGQRYAVLLKEDGSYVSPANPANRGERIRMFCAGLGQTNPATDTNRAGIPGQTVLAPLVVGVNNAGVVVISAETMVGVVGVYVLTFEIPSDTTPGPDRPLAVAIFPADGSPAIFGNPSIIAIE